LGLLLGVGLVLGLDYLDQTLRTPEQVERYLGIEVLSALPKLTEDNVRVLRESFQSLRTAVMLAARGEGCHILQVTSAVPSEGKTTVVFNLGKVLAAAGARVLLLDADLRKPRLHRIISAKNVRGLTSVVLGERELNEVITVVADVPNLDVVCSGPLPPNPPELYGKATFAKLLAQARQEYDWVIIDTAPVASVTDPVICSSLVDLVLLVVQYGHARRQLIRDAVRSLSRTGVRIAGCLLNKVDVERDHYYYSYYYSSYYRYGYGTDEEAERVINTTSAARTG
ncbi:MAG: CpsD/CapB family tyrosine-protein kinase, partial [Anaerolineae bacterium]